MSTIRFALLASIGSASLVGACVAGSTSEVPSQGSTSSSGGGGATTSGSSGATTSGGSGATTGGGGDATTSSSGAMSSSSGTSSGGAGGDQGATGVPCGASACNPPMSCCESTSAGAAPECVVACGANQKQLCVHDADCQSSGTSICMNGFCTDPGPMDSGVYVPPLEGGVPPPPTDAGIIPAGYPAPTAANRAECQTVPLGQGPGVSPGFCPGGGPGPVCIECLFGGATYGSSTGVTPSATAIAEAGNYLVTVDLGGAKAGDTYISAEANRALLASTTTSMGTSTEYSFVVNVRQREGQPQEAVANGYPGLDLFFSGTNPEVSAIGYSLVAATTQPIMVYVASDSTACDQTDQAYAGWGQALPEYFAPPVGIANYADSGESSSSFMGAQKWQGITAHWKPGDWVLIQFGHNDKGVTDAVVQANLEIYVTQALAAKVTPVLISPPARVQFTNGVEGDQSSLHAAAAAAAASAKNVAYIDLTALSTAWYNSLGSQAAALKFHANDSDATHTNMAGAVKLAGLVTGAMVTQKIPLAKYLR